MKPEKQTAKPRKKAVQEPAQKDAWHPIDLFRLTDACENGSKVPDLSDVLEWKSALLANPNHILEQLFPRFAALLRNPPLGFGFPVARAILATWHFRDHAEQAHPSRWNSLGMAALDVVANAVALWHIFPCPRCDRPLRIHGRVEFPKLRTTALHREAEELKTYRLAPPTLFVFDCGFPLRIPSWFPSTRELPYPHTPATCQEALSVARIVAREYLWRCMKTRYRKTDTHCAVADVVTQLFANPTNRKRLPRSSPGEQAGAIIRDGATEIVRAYERVTKAGVAGAGLGIVQHKGEMVYRFSKPAHDFTSTSRRDFTANICSWTSAGPPLAPPIWTIVPCP